MKRLRLWARPLHRDLGFFFAGITLIYAVSGIAVNHSGAWDPSFEIDIEEVSFQLPEQQRDLTEQHILDNLDHLGIARADYRTFACPSPSRVKVYLKNGSIDAKHGQPVATYETIRRRPLLYEVNFLHLNPKGWWTVFSDAFAVALILIAITGLVLTSGRSGLTRRGGLLLALGLVAPFMALLLT